MKLTTKLLPIIFGLVFTSTLFAQTITYPVCTVSGDQGTASNGVLMECTTPPTVWTPVASSISDASETVKGIVELATTAEAEAGTNDLLAMTPKKVLESIAANESGVAEGSAILSTGETGGVKFLREDGDNTSSWQPVTIPATEGTAVLSTGETGGVKFLREDGDNTSSWQPVPAAGMSDLVDDLTPELGGDLNVNNKQIISTGGLNIDLHSDNFIEFRLGDAAGNDRFDVLDSVGVNQFNVDSDGNVNATTVDVNNDNYDLNWNADNTVPTKNAVYDKIETLSTISKSVVIFGTSETVAVGNGANFYTIPIEFNSWNLVTVGMHLYTTGTTATLVQVRNQSNSLDMLSTLLTIDANESDTITAATAAVINTSNDHVNTGDVISFDVDAAGAGAQGLEVRLGFKKP